MREEQHPYICGANKQKLNEHRVWSLFLLAATVWSFVHFPLGVCNSNKVVLWSGWQDGARCNLHKKNVGSVWFIAQRKGCYCKLAVDIALKVGFTTKGMLITVAEIWIWTIFCFRICIIFCNTIFGLDFNLKNLNHFADIWNRLKVTVWGPLLWSGYANITLSHVKVSIYCALLTRDGTGQQLGGNKKLTVPACLC